MVVISATHAIHTHSPTNTHTDIRAHIRTHTQTHKTPLLKFSGFQGYRIATLSTVLVSQEELCVDWDEIKVEVMNRGNYEKRGYSEKELMQIRNLNRQVRKLFEYL